MLIEEKQKEVGAAKTALATFKSEYYAGGKSFKPRLQIFEGREELQQMMKDMLLYRDITAHVLWPVEKIIKLLGSDFYREFHKKRAARNIQIKVIWPRPQITAKTKYDFLKNDAELKREIRVAPKILISLWVTPFMPIPCDLFLRKENYGFLIESQKWPR